MYKSCGDEANVSGFSRWSEPDLRLEFLQSKKLYKYPKDDSLYLLISMEESMLFEYTKFGEMLKEVSAPFANIFAIGHTGPRDSLPAFIHKEYRKVIARSPPLADDAAISLCHKASRYLSLDLTLMLDEKVHRPQKMRILDILSVYRGQINILTPA